MSYAETSTLRATTLAQARKLIECLVNIKDETGEFLMPLEDGRVIDTKGWNDWEWSHGVGQLKFLYYELEELTIWGNFIPAERLYGLLRFHEITGDEYSLQIALKWFADRFEAGTTKNVNTMSPLLTAAYLHASGRANYGVHLDAWGEWCMHTMARTVEGGLQHATYLTENDGQLWDDTLMMCVLPLAKIGHVLDRSEYIEEAKRQFMLHIKYLVDRETGLWFHGWTFRSSRGRHHFSRALWGRGNCWITIAIPDFIELLALPPTDGLRLFLVSTLVAQIDALVTLQDPESGLWHTLLNDPTSYLEASATAGFAYGILKALRLRLIPRKESYVHAAQKAIDGILANISERGELLRVSFGTPVFDSLEDYKKVALTSMPYGQSCALLALTEHFRTLL